MEKIEVFGKLIIFKWIRPPSPLLAEPSPELPSIPSPSRRLLSIPQAQSSLTSPPAELEAEGEVLAGAGGPAAVRTSGPAARWLQRGGGSAAELRRRWGGTPAREEATGWAVVSGADGDGAGGRGRRRQGGTPAGAGGGDGVGGRLGGGGDGDGAGDRKNRPRWLAARSDEGVGKKSENVLGCGFGGKQAYGRINPFGWDSRGGWSKI
ncbi:hypothetical protein PVAP13_1KG323108 [Panicum virgatum]|uniref:Uncharacterized protein n=1 Tax=Panicum virgatum TaxID=38727 RepID=A0A8T0XAC7_PANVG|nr:hypothetical protein PVAP13_1KG323108 [Panicum virgatum]